MNAIRSLVTALAIVAAIAVPASADPAGAPVTAAGMSHFARAGDLDTDVELRWTERPSRNHGEDDPGPSVATGLVAIVSGEKRTNTIVPFASLGITPPNAMQIVPIDGGTCGASGPIDIRALPGSIAPAVVVTTIAIGKGCLPIVHVLLPSNDRSRHYVATGVFVMNAAPASRGERFTQTVRVKRTRTLSLPGNRALIVVDGVDAGDRLVSIAIATPLSGAKPLAGNVLGLQHEPNGFEGAAYLIP